MNAHRPWKPRHQTGKANVFCQVTAANCRGVRPLLLALSLSALPSSKPWCFVIFSLYRVTFSWDTRYTLHFLNGFDLLKATQAVYLSLQGHKPNKLLTHFLSRLAKPSPILFFGAKMVQTPSKRLKSVRVLELRERASKYCGWPRTETMGMKP